MAISTIIEICKKARGVLISLGGIKEEFMEEVVPERNLRGWVGIRQDEGEEVL